MSKEIHENSLMAEHRIKQYANMHQRDRKFNENNLVLLKLQPFQQSSVCMDLTPKLSPHFPAPFEVKQKVGEVAYKLKLPPTCHIYPIVHVSKLKKYIPGKQLHFTYLPYYNPDGLIVLHPKRIMRKKKNSSRWQGG